MLTNTIIYLMILAMIIILGAIFTKNPVGEQIAEIIAVIYMIPMFVVLFTIALISVPIHWVRKLLKV